MTWRTAPEIRLAATTSRPINDGRQRMKPAQWATAALTSLMITPALGCATGDSPTTTPEEGGWPPAS